MFDWITSAYELLAKGGVVMIPLMLCSVGAVAVIIERVARLREGAAELDGLMRDVSDALIRGNTAQATKLCEEAPGPVARVLACGVRNCHMDLDSVERQMEQQALSEIPGLHKNLVVLDTVITIAPLLGLLGTVTGMIGSFHVISSKGVSQPNAITGGVAEALIATATGLTIAITCLVAYNYLTDRVKTTTNQMEVRATQLINTFAVMRNSKNEVKAARA